MWYEMIEFNWKKISKIFVIIWFKHFKFRQQKWINLLGSTKLHVNKILIRKTSKLSSTVCNAFSSSSSNETSWQSWWWWYTHSKVRSRLVPSINTGGPRYSRGLRSENYPRIPKPQIPRENYPIWKQQIFLLKISLCYYDWIICFSV
jgi:hypothetical protein